MNDRPPYRVPPMAEIAELAGTNGLTLVSTFSGCGGSCLGFEWAGYRTLWASEFVGSAREVYRLNHPGVPVDDRDIREVTAAEVLDEIGLDVGELDVLEGSPPCAGFSLSGSGHKSWGRTMAYSETEQRVDDLFWEFSRLLDGLRPRTFVAENVKGLTVGKSKGYYKAILAELESCGYRVAGRVLDAQWLGVPQTRTRLILVGVRDDLDVDPPHPKPLPYRYSIRDAVPWIDEPNPEDPDVAEASIVGYAIEPEWRALRPGQSSDRYYNLVRPDPDLPCPTVTQTGGTLGAASVTHPHEPRKFTIAELRRLCGFPDDFQLTGTYKQRWERLGRAVPPPMMRAVAETIRDEVLLPEESAT